jgi:LL-diaminopimelate aminotransferase
MDFALNLLKKAHVLVLPGSAFGPGGEGFVRFSLVAPPARLEEAIERMKSALL